jgi:hypothetical protein
MGEESIQALNAPAKEGLRPHTNHTLSEAGAPAIPGFNTPIPAPIPKPKLPLPSLPSPNTSSNMVAKDTPTVTKRDWNTSKLGLRVGVDALSAGAAGALVAPIITMIDQGIMENASGRNTLGSSIKQSARELLLRPHRFISSKPFVLIFVRLPSSTSRPLPLTQNPTESLLRHLLHGQQHRHSLLDAALHPRVLHHSRHAQIPRNLVRQPRAVPLQRQQIHPTLRHRGVRPPRPNPHIRPLRRARLPHRLRVL